MEYKDINKVDSTEMPLTYPESMRTEVLVFMYISFKVRDAYKVISYKKVGNKVEFIKEDNFDEGLENGGSIRDSIAKGFALAAGEDMIKKHGKSAEDVYKEYPNLRGVINK